MTVVRGWLAPLFALLAACAAPAGADDKLLYRTRSAFNTLLVSEDGNGMRVLRFEPGGARQSVVKLGDPDHLEVAYAKAIPIALAYVPEPRSVLIVGLGGGTIPSFLRRRFPVLVIDVVEIDPAVVKVASSYFGFRGDARLRAYAEDGRAFIERRAAAYDIIILDAFGAREVPYALATVEFQRSVRRALRPRGVVIGNIWGRFDNPLYAAMVRTYRAVYEELAIVDLEGVSNKLVIACPWSPMPSREEVIRRARALSATLALRAGLGAIVERGLRPAGGDDAGAQVLTDDSPPGAAGSAQRQGARLEPMDHGYRR